MIPKWLIEKGFSKTQGPLPYHCCIEYKNYKFALSFFLISRQQHYLLYLTVSWIAGNIITRLSLASCSFLDVKWIPRHRNLNHQFPVEDDRQVFDRKMIYGDVIDGRCTRGLGLDSTLWLKVLIDPGMPMDRDAMWIKRPFNEIRIRVRSQLRHGDKHKINAAVAIE